MKPYIKRFVSLRAFSREGRWYSITSFHLGDAKRNKANAIRDANDNKAQICLCWHWSKERVKVNVIAFKRNKASNPGKGCLDNTPNDPKFCFVLISARLETTAQIAEQTEFSLEKRR